MNMTIYQVDAFTDHLFGGNPAAVCILENWTDDSLMQHIAVENNLSETAFAVKRNTKYEIRWFTPELEVDLCGHATLATAHVLFTYCNHPSDKIDFISPHSGRLVVEKAGDLLTLDFPADIVEEVKAPDSLIDALGKPPDKSLKGKTDYLLIYRDQKSIEELKPDFQLLAKAGGRGVIVSARGEKVDFVSRFFAPQSGVNEDPVTGSAHTTLIPYWAKELTKNKMTARQLSKRKGDLICESREDRVKISGKAVTYLIGEIFV